jgi:sigma54-dependent transcription regulator
VEKRSQKCDFAKINISTKNPEFDADLEYIEKVHQKVMSQTCSLAVK